MLTLHFRIPDAELQVLERRIAGCSRRAASVSYRSTTSSGVRFPPYSINLLQDALAVLRGRYRPEVSGQLVRTGHFLFSISCDGRRQQHKHSDTAHAACTHSVSCLDYRTWTCPPTGSKCGPSDQSESLQASLTAVVLAASMCGGGEASFGVFGQPCSNVAPAGYSCFVQA